MPFESWIDKQARDESIQSRGWAVVRLIPNPGDPGSSLFTYTVGLTGAGHPELLAIGAEADRLEELGRLVTEQGQALADGQRVSLPSGQVLIREVTPERPFVPEAAFEEYGEDRVRVHQVLVPDGDSRLLPHISVGIASSGIPDDDEELRRLKELLAQPPKRRWWWPPSWF